MKKILPIFGFLLCAPAFADYSPNFFLGGNFGFTSVAYDDYYDDKYMPGTHFNIGLEGGVRFGGTDSIYNIGLTGFYNYAVDAKADPEAAWILGVDSISVGYYMLGATLDNYIRIAKWAGEDGVAGSTTYLVLGLGYSRVTQEGTIKLYDISVSMTDTVGAPVFKIGGIHNFTENMGMTLGMQAFAFENASIGNFNLGFRYTF